ncbi:MAG: hypothetical protein OXU29_07160 [Gammaproteobacteria bacterium]|nr:hypothetical protein [Gammaproteobacteria bacterium]
MKTQTIIFALATVIFAAPALADHNKTSWLFWKEGHWTEVTEDGDVFEGHYVNGERLGPWSARLADGFVGECLYVKDKDCNWVLRDVDGNVFEEGHFVDNKRHGHWAGRFDGEVWEGPYVSGKKHGQWVYRLTDGSGWEGPFVDGKQHGHWAWRDDDGDIGSEGPYVNGKKHGHWVLRFADGGVWEGPYVDGKKHGHWVVRLPDGTVKHVTYRNGLIIK